MQEVIKEGKTVEEAVAKALEEIQMNEEDVAIQVLQEPAKGIFGLTKMARVKVSYKSGNVQCQPQSESTNPDKNGDDEVQKAREILNKIFKFMGTPVSSLKINKTESGYLVSLQSESEGLIIGKHGQTLDAIQYLLNRMVNKNLDSNYNKFILDIGGYRNRHQQILEKIAKRVAKEVAETKRSQSLEQMNAYDRRIVHLCLKDHPEVSTFSDGEGSYRHIVITPKDCNESLSKGHAEIG